MPYIESIVKHINSWMLVNALGDECFASKKVYVLAQLMKKVDEQEGRHQLIPCVVDHDGNAIYAGVDDTEDLIIYHRVNELLVQKANLKAFGDSQQVDAHICSMCMVVFGQRILG